MSARKVRKVIITGADFRLVQLTKLDTPHYIVKLEAPYRLEFTPDRYGIKSIYHFVSQEVALAALPELLKRRNARHPVLKHLEPHRLNEGIYFTPQRLRKLGK